MKILLRQKSSTSLGSIANYYIVYSLSPGTNSSSIVLENCLFGKIKMTKSVDTDKYRYQGNRIGLDSTGNFTHLDGETGKNVIIFGVGMTISKHANNKTKDVLVLGRGLIQKIDDTTIYAEKMYSPNFTVANRSYTLYYKADDSYLFVNGKKSLNLRSKTKVYQENYHKETSRLILTIQTENQQGFMDMFMILVLTIMLLQLMTY